MMLLDTSIGLSRDKFFIVVPTNYEFIYNVLRSPKDFDERCIQVAKNGASVQFLSFQCQFVVFV